jgi:hypothetical protein
MIAMGWVPRDDARRVDFRAVAGELDRPVGVARGGVRSGRYLINTIANEPFGPMRVRVVRCVIGRLVPGHLMSAGQRYVLSTERRVGRRVDRRAGQPGRARCRPRGQPGSRVAQPRAARNTADVATEPKTPPCMVTMFRAAS